MLRMLHLTPTTAPVRTAGTLAALACAMTTGPNPVPATHVTTIGNMMNTLTTELDKLVATLNTDVPRRDIEISVWYSFNDGTWKWAALTPAPTFADNL